MCGRNESTHQTRSPISSIFCTQPSPSLFFPEAYLSGEREGGGGADNVVVHRWDGFSIKMGEQRMHAHVPRRRDGGNHERKEEEEDLARIDVNEILSALPPLPVSLRLTLVVLSCVAPPPPRNKSGSFKSRSETKSAISGSG